MAIGNKASLSFTHLALFVVSCLLLLRVSSLAAASSSTVDEEACKTAAAAAASKVDVDGRAASSSCAASRRRPAEGGGGGDDRRFAREATAHAKSRCDDVVVTMGKLLSAETDVRMANALKECEGLYTDADVRLQEAVNALDANDVVRARASIDVTRLAPLYCEKRFWDQGMQSPVSTENNDMTQLIAIALALVNRL